MLDDEGQNDDEDDEDDCNSSSFVAPLLSRYPANSTMEMFPKSYRPTKDRRRLNKSVEFLLNRSKCFFMGILAIALVSFVALGFFYNEANFGTFGKHLIMLNMINISSGSRKIPEIDRHQIMTSSSSSSSSLSFEFQTTVPVHMVSFRDIVEGGQRFDIRHRDVIVFLHIQKTGGSTFERHLVSDIDLEQPCICDAASSGMRPRKGRKKNKRLLRKRPPKRLSCDCPRPTSNLLSSSSSSSSPRSDFSKNNESATMVPLSSSSLTTWLFSRFNIGWKCGVHADWTELTECVDPYLDSREGVENRRYFYTTFLRDPIKRYISEFLNVQRGSTWWGARFKCNGEMASEDQLAPCYATETWEGVTLEEFMSCQSNLAVNRQTRMLADLRLVNCYNTTGISKVERDETILGSAKANLEKMAFFGLTSRQKDSQVLFEKTLGFRFKTQFQDDPDLAGPYEENIDDVTMGKIKELNHLDVQLFEFAEELLKQRLRRSLIGAKSDDDDDPYKYWKTAANFNSVDKEENDEDDDVEDDEEEDSN